MRKYVYYILVSILMSLCMTLKVQAGKTTTSVPCQVRGFMVETAENLDRQTLVDAKSWGANVVRLQLNPVNYALKRKKDFWKTLPQYLDLVQQRIDDAREIGLWVVVDLHEPPLVVDGKVPSSTYQGTHEFWQTPGLKDNFVRMWREIARKFKGKKYKGVIWGYDIFNEPQINWVSIPKEWLAMVPDIVGAIRDIDKDTWIVVQPVVATSEFNTLKPFDDRRIIYSIHFYNPFGFTHQGVEKVFESSTMTREEAMNEIKKEYPGTYYDHYVDKKALEDNIRPFAEFLDKYRVPGYIGEFSTIAWAPVESSKRWFTDVLDIFERHHLSWSYHAFREWAGWSLEHAEDTSAFWFKHEPQPKPVDYETQRARIIKEGLKKNR